MLSLVHHRIRNPVKKLALEMKRNVAKTADIDPDLKTVDEDFQEPVKDKDAHPVRGQDIARDEKPHATTSAHAMSDATVNERPTSQRTKSQRRLRVPTGAHGETEDNQRFPDLAPPARRQVDAGDGQVRREEEEEEDKDFDVHGFDHPSTYAPQPWVWVPRDPFGLSGVLVRGFRAAGVEASDEGAVMDEKGTVEVYRSPPDEDWSGGHDA